MQGPDVKALGGVSKGAWIVAGLDPFGQRARVDEYAKAGVEALAMEFMPRITRAQSMDILSSQSNLSGYKAVIEAASVYGEGMRRISLLGQHVLYEVDDAGQRVTILAVVGQWQYPKSIR